MTAGKGDDEAPASKPAPQQAPGQRRFTNYLMVPAVALMVVILFVLAPQMKEPASLRADECSPEQIEDAVPPEKPRTSRNGSP